MKKLGLSVVPLLLAAATPAIADGDAILGVWRSAPTDKGYAHIEVVRSDEIYQGRVVWLSEPDFPPGDPQAGRPKADRLNPDPGLRGRPILNMPLMEGFRYDGGAWEGGRIYDPETGRTYKCVLRLTDDGTLKVRGYVGVSLLGRTTVWRPVGP